MDFPQVILNQRFTDYLSVTPFYGFFDVGAQRIPRVVLGENVVRKTLAHEPSVGFMGNAENNFHGRNLAERRTGNKLPFRWRRGEGLALRRVIGFTRCRN